MFKGVLKTGLTTVDSLQKQVSNSLSLFTTILENLKKAQENLSQQINLRDAEIKRLTAEQETLEKLHEQSANTIDKISQIIG